jgi:hypothetical protein
VVKPKTQRKGRVVLEDGKYDKGKPLLSASYPASLFLKGGIFDFQVANKRTLKMLEKSWERP